MNLSQIKQAIDEGKTVYYQSHFYTVKKQPNGDYYICSGTGHCIGLTWTDGVTLNGREKDFFTNN